MLSKISPTAKLIANFLAVLACVMVFDPMTPLMLFIAAISLGVISRSFRLKQLKIMIPFLLFAFGMVWINAAWARPEGAIPIGSFGPIVFTDRGLSVGISLGMRVMAIAAISILFTSNLDPTDTVLSLVQQWHLHPKLAYSILAALRFLPTLETELNIIRAAHRIRGTDSDGWRGSVRRWYRYAIPLLAGGIRRAERTAIAMEARGFNSAEVKRTYYRVIRWQMRDTIFILATIIIIAVIIWISNSMGWLVGFRMWQGF